MQSTDYYGIQIVSSIKCDPPYDFRDKGDNTLTTRFHLKTKEIDFNMLTKHARAHFNELVLFSHITHYILKAIKRASIYRTMKCVNLR